MSTKIDALALDFARRVEARQLRGDNTIPQLPIATFVSPQDLVPIYHVANGLTEAIPVGLISTVPILGNYEPVFNAREGYGMNVNNTDVQNTTALQNAINACAAAGGGKVVIPDGIYQYQGGIVIPEIPATATNSGAIQITGQTRNTQLMNTQNTDSFIVQNIATIINNLHLTYASGVGGRGFVMISVNNVFFQNVLVQGATVAWYMFDCGATFMFECFTQSRANAIAGLWIDGGSATGGNFASGSIQIQITQCSFSGTVGPAILLGHCQTIRFTNVDFWGFDNGIEIGSQQVAANPDRGNFGGVPGLPNGTLVGGVIMVGGVAWKGVNTALIDLVNCETDDAMPDSGIFIHPPMYPIATTAGVTPVPWRVVDIRFTQCHFQTGANGILLTSDTFGGGSFGVINAIQINSCTSTFNQANGLHIQAGSDINIVGGLYCGNGINGIFIDGSISGVPLQQIIVSSVKADQRVGIGGASQNYGINVTGLASDITVVGCDFSGNISASINIDGTLNAVQFASCFLAQFAGSDDPIHFGGSFAPTLVSMVNCEGYNDQKPVLFNGAAPSGAQSGYSWNFSGGPYLGPIVVYSSGGMDPVHVATQNTFLATGSFPLVPTEAISQTGGGSPVWVVIGQ